MGRLLGLALLALGLLAGCGDAGGEGSRRMPPMKDRVPITSRAIAAIMLDHLPAKTARREEQYVDRGTPGRPVGADFRYHASEGEDGDLVRVTVQRGHLIDSCPEDQLCAVLPAPERGAHAFLLWEKAAPEEDPGYVALVVDRPGESVLALSSGAHISRDPRRMRLEPSVTTLRELAAAPRLRVRTSPAAVAAGEKVAQWHER